jgi:hypothetical protein
VTRKNKNKGGTANVLPPWPRFRYEVKGDYIRIIDPSGSVSKPIPPVGSPYRTLEIYRAAKKCLLDNLKGPLIAPHEYKKLFDTLRLHHLNLEVMTLKGIVRGICVVCYKFLTGAQKSYCSALCQNTAKQRRRLASGKKALR